MIRVLVINNNIVLQSGITVVIKNLIENTAPNTIKYTIVTGPDVRNNFEVFENLGVEVMIMPRLSPLGLFSFISFFKRLFTNRQFDIIHSHFSQIDNIIFPLAKKHGIKKCISHCHSSKLSDSWWKGAIYKIMCFKLYKRADYCAACSKQAGIAWYGHSFPRMKNKLIIKNGIDCSKYVFNNSLRLQFREQYQIDPDCVVIGHVGRFNVGKNQLFLVYLIEELLQRGKDYKLFLVGKGETMDSIKKIVDSLILNDKIIFVGGRDDVNQVLNLFDVFVMPSIHEGLGIAAVEAQANGLDCILSDSIPDDADLTGVKFLSLNDSISLWADAIESLPFKHHENYNQIVIDAGYDIHKVGEELTMFYKKIISNEY